MPIDFPRRRFACLLLASLAALACLAPAGAAGDSLPTKPGGALSPPLEELADPAVANRSPAAQADYLGLPRRGPGSLVRDGERVLVTARFARGALASFDALRQAGARIVSASASTQTVTLAAAPRQLAALEAVPGLKSAWEVPAPIVRAPESPCEGGATISEGLGQLRVDEARETFELRGKGLTVGVLSDSFDTAEQGGDPPATDAGDDEVSGDLPGPAGTCSNQQLPVDVLEDLDEPGGDEGRAMLQIVHDLAPHASLAFATAFESEEGFAQNVERLARPVADGGAGAEVIVDDVAWFHEPFFQDGPIAVAIEKVTAAGASYFSAAGNDNVFDSSGREIGSWEAPAFRDSGPCPSPILLEVGLNGTHCMDFDPGVAVDQTFALTVAPDGELTLDLQWAEPWNGVGTDLDAYLLSGSGQFLDWSTNENDGSEGTQRPVEIINWENESSSSVTVHLAINRYAGDGSDPRLKFILLQSGGVTASEYPTSSGGDVVGPTIYGHAGAASAISVGAVPFNNSGKIESYSSRGPVTHYFGPVEGTTPAAPLGAPEELAKPDLAATDCGATTFFAFLSAGTWRFCGTSAAAPHAATAAALIRQAKPALLNHQVRDVLTDTAVPVGAFPANAAGAGLVDAFAAISSLPGPLEGGDVRGEEVPPTDPPPPPEPEPEPTARSAPQNTPPVGVTPIPVLLAPETTILRRPPKLVRAGAAARLAFRFGSDQSDATFLCKVDRWRFRSCANRLVRRFARGRHLVRVKAVGPSGLTDPTPASFGFRVVSPG